MNKNITVVMYHYVRNLTESNYPNINGLDLSHFKEQLLYFKKKYSFISIEELIAAYNDDFILPDNPIILTFDDGYIDHYSNVFPLLFDMKIQGCFYPPASTILDKKILDVNKVHFMLASIENKNSIIDEILSQLDKYREPYNLKDNTYYLSKFAKQNRFDSKEIIFIKRILQVGLPEDLREKITDFLFKKYVTKDEKGFNEELYMSLKNVKTMIDNGMHFGSHGYKHYWLSSLSKKDQEVEISKSLDFLHKAGSNLDLWTMCFPYGDYNKHTINLLEKYDCKVAFTTKVNVAHLDKDNRFEIPRLDTNDLPKDRNKN